MDLHGRLLRPYSTPHFVCAISKIIVIILITISLFFWWVTNYARVGAPYHIGGGFGTRPYEGRRKAPLEWGQAAPTAQGPPGMGAGSPYGN